ncbi:hypothetical protein REPUB_Repub04eG0157900 [Reevesia pubescens]
MSKGIIGPLYPFIAECLALKDALQFALKTGFRKVVVKGDSIITVCAIKTRRKIVLLLVLLWRK